MKIKPCDLSTHLWAAVNPCINVVVLFLITIRVLQMGRSRWMKNRKITDFISGMIEFMNLAKSTKRRIGDADYILCPCTDCANTESHKFVDVQLHLVSRGFMDGCTRWTRHGEEEVMDEDTQGCEMPNPDQCCMDIESNRGRGVKLPMEHRKAETPIGKPRHRRS